MWRWDRLNVVTMLPQETKMVKPPRLLLNLKMHTRFEVCITDIFIKSVNGGYAIVKAENQTSEDKCGCRVTLNRPVLLGASGFREAPRT